MPPFHSLQPLTLGLEIQISQVLTEQILSSFPVLLLCPYQLFSCVAASKLGREQFLGARRRALDAESSVVAARVRRTPDVKVTVRAAGYIHNLGMVLLCEMSRARGAFELIELAATAGCLGGEELLGSVAPVGCDAILEGASLDPVAGRTSTFVH